jgi:hypothetical protein
MIEIITEKVKMSELYKRKFQKKFVNNNWSVIDTETNIIVYKGEFENVCLAWHNLNKKYYKD